MLAQRSCLVPESLACSSKHASTLSLSTPIAYIASCLYCRIIISLHTWGDLTSRCRMNQWRLRNEWLRSSRLQEQPPSVHRTLWEWTLNYQRNTERSQHVTSGSWETRGSWAIMPRMKTCSVYRSFQKGLAITPHAMNESQAAQHCAKYCLWCPQFYLPWLSVTCKLPV